MEIVKTSVCTCGEVVPIEEDYYFCQTCYRLWGGNRYYVVTQTEEHDQVKTLRIQIFECLSNNSNPPHADLVGTWEECIEYVQSFGIEYTSSIPGYCAFELSDRVD